MILYNKTKKIVVSKNLSIADKFSSRFLGLIPKKNLNGDEGLMINRCTGVHTCFMRFDIDVIFATADLKVVDVITLKPWRFSKFYESEYAIEFNSGFVYDKISVGDILAVE